MGTVVFIWRFVVTPTAAVLLAALCVYVLGKIVGVL